MAEHAGQAIEPPSDHGAANRRPDQMTEELLPEPVARVRLRPCGPLGFRLLQTLEPLVERFEPGIWWKLRDLAGIVLCHVTPLCVARGGNPWARRVRETWRKAAPPRRGSFMKGGADSQ